jgi:class 3 adenylate cyclase/tetratricopeptide (TPR) repeat protein
MAERSEDKRQTSPAAPGGRYRLTMLFTDLSGSTAISEAMEAEIYSELLAALRVIWHDVVEKHGGLIFQSRGDGALAVFGYPQCGEDDGRRAAEAALDIHDRVHGLRVSGLPKSLVPLSMHSGIHAGVVLLNEGDIERGRFDVTGVVANTTSHLSDAAGPDQILASLDALGPNANFFEVGADPRDPKARVEPAGVLTILRRGTVTRRFDATAKRGLTPLIGRGEVIGYLRDYLAADEAPPLRCVLIEGAAGLGKTRLLEELVQQREAAAFTTLVGNCETYLGAEVLQPFLQMLRSYFGLAPGMPRAEAAASVRETLQSWVAELGASAEALPGLLVSEGETRNVRRNASGVVGDLLTFFTALAKRTTLLILIDDWQWADDASRQLLEALLQLPTGPRVILACRPREDGADWIAGAPKLELSPFEEAETEIAVRRWLPYADPFLIGRIHAYAGGVPLFVEELCHSVPTDTLLRSLQGRAATQTWLATLVMARLGRLPPDLAALARAAAVIGNVVPMRLLETVCEGPVSDAALRALAAADFLYPVDRGVLQFKHGITRNAIYQGIGLHERTALHRRIEQALVSSSEHAEGEDALEALAYHCHGSGHWELAARYAERAGDKAMNAFALDHARAQYQTAMDALNNIPNRSREHSLMWCSLANKLGMACIFDPLALSDELSVFEKAVTLARDLGDANALARAQYWLGYMCYGFGSFREGVTHARQALALARQIGDLRLAAQVEATLGQILAATCDYDEALTLMDRAVDTKRQGSRAGGALAIGSAYTLSCKGSVLADRGDFGAAHACFDEAMRLLDGSTHPVANSVRNWVAVAHVWEGNWAEAERVAKESARIAENTRCLLLLVVCRAAAGYAHWAGTRDPDGLVQLRDAVRWMEARHGQFYSSLHYGWLVEACVAEGHIDEARGYAAHVLMRARRGERLGEAVASRALAAAAADNGNFLRADRWLRRAETSARIRASKREMALNHLARTRLAGKQDQAEAASPVER